MKYCKSRIAVSVFFALVALAFAVLCVRSYSLVDTAFTQSFNNHQLGLSSISGVVVLEVFTPQTAAAWTIRSDPIPQPNAKLRPFGSLWNNPPAYFAAKAPHWLVAIVASACAAIPWATNRFSVRALLIATTLVAIVLGLVVWAGR